MESTSLKERAASIDAKIKSAHECESEARRLRVGAMVVLAECLLYGATVEVGIEEDGDYGAAELIDTATGERFDMKGSGAIDEIENRIGADGITRETIKLPLSEVGRHNVHDSEEMADDTPITVGYRFKVASHEELGLLIAELNEEMLGPVSASIAEGDDL